LESQTECGAACTVFGKLESESVALTAEYRSHGGLAEAEVPLLVHNAEQAPKADYFTANVDLARWLLPA
jgi:hypothetical protein